MTSRVPVEFKYAVTSEVCLSDVVNLRHALCLLGYDVCLSKSYPSLLSWSPIMRPSLVFELPDDGFKEISWKSDAATIEAIEGAYSVQLDNQFDHPLSTVVLRPVPDMPVWNPGNVLTLTFSAYLRHTKDYFTEQQMRDIRGLFVHHFRLADNTIYNRLREEQIMNSMFLTSISPPDYEVRHTDSELDANLFVHYDYKQAKLDWVLSNDRIPDDTDCITMRCWRCRNYNRWDHYAQFGESSYETLGRYVAGKPPCCRACIQSLITGTDFEHCRNQYH